MQKKVRPGYAQIVPKLRSLRSRNKMWSCSVQPAASTPIDAATSFSRAAILAEIACGRCSAARHVPDEVEPQVGSGVDPSTLRNPTHRQTRRFKQVARDDRALLVSHAPGVVPWHLGNTARPCACSWLRHRPFRQSSKHARARHAFGCSAQASKRYQRCPISGRYSANTAATMLNSNAHSPS
jgi:hypothetical protein